MPQNPYFSRKMMGFDGGGLGLASATLRCTSKPHGDYAVGFCFFVRRRFELLCNIFHRPLLTYCDNFGIIKTLKYIELRERIRKNVAIANEKYKD